jgi:hypothetical protein
VRMPAWSQTGGTGTAAMGVQQRQKGYCTAGGSLLVPCMRASSLYAWGGLISWNVQLFVRQAVPRLHCQTHMGLFYGPKCGVGAVVTLGCNCHLPPRSMGLLGVARANNAVGVSPETFLLLLLPLDVQCDCHMCMRDSIQVLSRPSCQSSSSEPRLMSQDDATVLHRSKVVTRLLSWSQPPMTGHAVLLVVGVARTPPVDMAGVAARAPETWQPPPSSPLVGMGRQSVTLLQVATELQAPHVLLLRLLLRLMPARCLSSRVVCNCAHHPPRLAASPKSTLQAHNALPCRATFQFYCWRQASVTMPHRSQLTCPPLPPSGGRPCESCAKPWLRPGLHLAWVRCAAGLL